MSYYNSEIYYGAREDAFSFDQQQGGRPDRDASLANTELGSTYSSGYKDDFNVPDDPHLALTSQTLNADGTPKRPMNAFMIFARKRRPEISAANQMMRTGDVSKILSREWNTMEMPEKKFYLDQAKKLKDTFNARYPDYVYRRRPNNSRKKRKPEVGHDPSAEGSPSAERETSADEVSPQDVDNIDEAALHDYQYQLAHSSASASQANYNGAVQSHSLSGYPATSPPFSSARYDERSSMSHQRFSSSTSPPLTGGMQATQAAELDVPDLWSLQRESARAGRVPLLPALDTGLTRQRASDSDRPADIRPETTSPHAGMRGWGGGAYSTSPGSSSVSMTHSSNAAFPTLTSPFAPAQSPSPRSVDSMSSPMPQYSAAQDYASGQPTYAPRGAPTLSRSDSAFGHRGFTHTNVLPPPTNVYMPQDQVAGSWSQYRSFLAPHPNLSPSTLSMSSIPLHATSPTTSSPPNPASMATALPPMGYMDRNRFEGR